MRIKRRLPGWRQPERRAAAQNLYNNRFAVIIPQNAEKRNRGGAGGGKREQVKSEQADADAEDSYTEGRYFEPGSDAGPWEPKGK